jgi:hypothetical protein
MVETHYFRCPPKSVIYQPKKGAPGLQRRVADSKGSEVWTTSVAERQDSGPVWSWGAIHKGSHTSNTEAPQSGGNIGTPVGFSGPAALLRDTWTWESGNHRHVIEAPTPGLSQIPIPNGHQRRQQKIPGSYVTAQNLRNCMAVFSRHPKSNRYAENLRANR